LIAVVNALRIFFASFQINVDDVGELLKLRLIIQPHNFAPWHLEKVNTA